MIEKLQYPGSIHGHTEYSNIRLRDCVIKLDKYIWGAAELGHSMVGLTDHDCLSGHVKAIEVYKQVKEKYPDFKLALGNEIYLVRDGLSNENFISGQDRYYHFVLLAKDSIGHKQIREISTRAWKRSYMARGMRRVPTYYQDLIDIIGANPGHVIGSTACLGGALPTQLLQYQKSQDKALYKKILIWADRLSQVFGKENFYLEMQPSNNPEQVYVNEEILKMSENYGYRYIITTDSHYLHKEDRTVHRAYLRAQNGDREVDAFYATTYMMGTEELESYMTITEDQLQTAYQNILNIRSQIEDYELTKPLKIPQLQWRKFHIESKVEDWYDRIPYFQPFWESDFEGDRELVKALIQGLEEDERCQNEETYEAVNRCLDMTWVSSEKNKAKWSSYFLNLQRIVDECWEAGTIVGGGRGSGVGFILLYLIEITQVNPLWEETQTFEWRFLNPDRVSVLDIDIDIEGVRRNDVLQHLRDVYGEDRVANVATFRQEKSKSAILTRARGLGVETDVAQYLSSMIVSDRGITRTLSQTFYGDKENGFSPNKQFVIEMTDNYPDVWEVASKIEGLVCGYGIHAGGVIFVDEPFEESTSLMRAPDGTTITAYELRDAERCSLIKYDLLSVEALDKMHICLDLLCEYGYIEEGESLKETYMQTIGLYTLERKDPKMWEMVWNHEVQSLFQMEKQSGIQGIALTKPESVDELAVLNSVSQIAA